MDFLLDHSYLIPLLPLLGAVIAGSFGARWLKGQSHWPIWLGVGASALMSLTLLWTLSGLAHHPQAAGEGVTSAVHSGSATAAAGDSAHGDTAHADTAHATDTGHGLSFTRNFFTWIEAGDPAKAGTSEYFNVKAGFFIDPLTVVMLSVVCGIGLLITVFAAGYMKGEAGYFRFFAYLGLFIFAMTTLVMGENLILLYLGWEGVGLCSYLLIGYYYEKPAAREAAKKAFLVNRIGDLGFALGIMLSFMAFGTVSYFGAAADATPDGLLEMVGGTLPLTAFQAAALDWIPFCLLLGAIGKSAQFPLYVWLPDAMEGPTPVSALIHAATMVTAGVYMIARCGTLFVANEAALMTIAAIGAFTAIFAGSIALRQYDLKKVFAYSTVSQLGFMFAAVGVLAPVAGVFHLITHAFFKALLFLSSGVVMHAMAGELDLRKMSGLKSVLPRTRWLMLIGCAALAGFPLLSGFFSKDEIVAAAFEKNTLLGLVLLVTAFMTAYYAFRVYFRVFHGPEVIPAAVGGHGGHDSHARDAHAADSHAVAPHGHDAHGGHGLHDHEPAIMMMPLYVLAVGAILSGFWLYSGHRLGHFLGQSPSLQRTAMVADVRYGADTVNPVALGQSDWREPAEIEAEHYAHIRVMITSGLVALSGIGLAYWLHLKNRPAADAWAARFSGFTRVLDAKYWVDEIYLAMIVEPLRRLGKAFWDFDVAVVDKTVDLVAAIPQAFGFTVGRTVQRGHLQGYAAAMAVGVLVILVLMFL